eukprot:11159533-Lingulodinium_polyedra.AAC.1
MCGRSASNACGAASGKERFCAYLHLPAPTNTCLHLAMIVLRLPAPPCTDMRRPAPTCIYLHLSAYLSASVGT